MPKVSGAVIFVDGQLVELPDHPMNHHNQVNLTCYRSNSIGHWVVEENSQILQIQLNLTSNSLSWASFCTYCLHCWWLHYPERLYIRQTPACWYQDWFLCSRLTSAGQIGEFTKWFSNAETVIPVSSLPGETHKRQSCPWTNWGMAFFTWDTVLVGFGWARQGEEKFWLLSRQQLPARN